MTTTLRTLLDRVEKGEGRDLSLEGDLLRVLLGDDLRQWPKRYLGLGEAITSSIDAAVALVEKVLPRWKYGFESDREIEGRFVGSVWRDGAMASSLEQSQTRTPARAILAATLRAKIAQEGEEAYWSAPKDEDRCTAMAAAYRAMRAAAKADAPDPHVLQDRLHGMLRMAVASEDSFNRLSPAGRRLIQAAEGFFASSREDRDDLNACWDALQAETKRADAAEARLAALLRAKIAQEEGA